MIHLCCSAAKLRFCRLDTSTAHTFSPKLALRRDCIVSLPRFCCLSSCKHFPYCVVCDVVANQCFHRMQIDTRESLASFAAEAAESYPWTECLTNIEASLPWTRPVRLCRSDKDLQNMAYSLLCDHRTSCKGLCALLACSCTSDGSRRTHSPAMCSELPGCDK